MPWSAAGLDPAARPSCHARALYDAESRHSVDGEPVLRRRTTTGCQRKEDGAVLAGRLLVGEDPIAIGVVNHSTLDIGSRCPDSVSH
jgi:hypothetical protein